MLDLPSITVCSMISQRGKQRIKCISLRCRVAKRRITLDIIWILRIILLLRMILMICVKKEDILLNKIIPKTEERPSWFLSKLEKSLIDNKINYSDQEDWIKKKINFSELKSPMRPGFEFTFSNLSTAGTNY